MKNERNSGDRKIIPIYPIIRFNRIRYIQILLYIYSTYTVIWYYTLYTFYTLLLKIFFQYSLGAVWRHYTAVGRFRSIIRHCWLEFSKLWKRKMMGFALSFFHIASRGHVFIRSFEKPMFLQKKNHEKFDVFFQIWPNSSSYREANSTCHWCHRSTGQRL